MATKAKQGAWRITVVEQHCSLCGACAQWCGPKALTLDQADGGVALRFDAGHCPGCGLCVEACPEKAITLTAIMPTAMGADGVAVSGVPVAKTPVLLAASPLANCVRCGAPSVPTRMLGSLARWSEVLGGGAAATTQPTRPGDHNDPGDPCDPGDPGGFATCMACRSDMMFFGGSSHA